ncbi:MAG: hypothetical protein HRU70_07870 [Phycisphaeraceae bacterium]|nr:MAG: hypothetical protein HRU70_07870 [Phycisphaeraceae bacterium]
MKNLLAWVKAHALIVLFSAIIVVSIPVGFVLSRAWDKSITSKRETEASDKLKKVKGATVTYQLPALTPGGQALSDARPANDLATEHYAKLRESLKQLAGGVSKRAAEFNEGRGDLAKAAGRSPHRPLIDGLFDFPAPAAPGAEDGGTPPPPPRSRPEDEVRIGLLTNEFADRLVDRPGKPSAYAVMLRQVLNAGGPLDPQALTQRLNAEYSTQIQKVRGADPNRAITDQERDVIAQALLAFRRNAYVQRAGEVSVYATLECLPIEGNPGAGPAVIPRSIPATPPPVWQAFRWQMDYWFVSDLFHAVRLANTSRTGAPSPVSSSVIKRIEKLTISDVFAAPPPERFGGDDMGGDSAAPAAPSLGESDLTTLVPINYAVSITGRHGGPQNPLYDVRRAELVAVVSASRLPEVFDAFARTNFLTVIGLDLAEVDVPGDLEKGFYYGDESVVRATIRVESVWLRSWTTPYMPWEIRAALGMPVPESIKVDLSGLRGTGGGFDGGPGMDRRGEQPLMWDPKGRDVRGGGR